LAKKKKPAKKVVEKFEWIEEPVDKTIKQGSLDEVTSPVNCLTRVKKPNGTSATRNATKAKNTP
jgi:hypothetical protein